ncbi:MAG: PAS domain-containing sensor histidine kinase [Almyronema sp.]
MNSDETAKPFVGAYWRQIAKAVEHASDGIIITDKDGNFVYANPAWINLFGYSLAALETAGGAEVLYEDTQQLQTIRETVSQQGNWSGEALMRNHQGDRRVVLVKVDTIHNEAQELVGYVGLHTDITAERQAQQERDRLLQRLSTQNQNLETLIQERTLRLQQQARTLNTILESSPDHIYCVDRQYRFLYAARPGAGSMGLQPGDMIGRTCSEVGLPQRLVIQLERQIKEVFATRQPGIYQTTVATVKGNRVFEYALSPIITENADVEAVVINARDITECQRNQAVLEALVEETASTVGEAFFPALVRHLAQTLGVQYATVTEQVRANQLETIAVWANDGATHTVSGATANTPDAIALQQGIYCCPERIQRQFPQCQPLQQLGAVSYFAVALVDRMGQSIGLLSVIDDKPFQYSEAVEKILRIFAARASAELERQRMTQALRASEENFRTIFQQAAVGMCRVDADGYFVQVNQRLCSILGYAEAELLQMSFDQITHPEDSSLGLDLHERLKAGVISTFTLEKRYLHKTGKTVWVNLSVSALCSTSEAAFYSLAVVEDITARKQAEAQLRRSEARFKRIAANVPGAIYQFILSADGQQQIPYISSRVQEILELEPEMIQQEAAVLWDRVHPEDRILLEESIAVSARRLMRWSWEGRFVSASGGIVWVKGIAEPERQADGSTLWDGLLIDISRRRRAEEEIQKAIAKERELNELKSRFIATTSHEFRTPLAVISSSAGILRDFSDRLDEAKKQKHFDTIQTYVRHTTQLLDDLLFINQAGTNQLPFKPIALDLLSWCRQLVEKMQLDAPQHQLRLTISRTATRLAEGVYLDEHLLERILTNLISNSVKYSPVSSQIEVKLDLQIDQIHFSVTDNGPGILEKDRAYLFEPFYRGYKVAHIPGIGLGLSIAKQCVELHRGRISFESQVGHGTTFYFSLPLSPLETAVPLS